MKRRLWTVALAAALALTACDPPPLSGTVEHKSYSAPYTYYTYPCMAYGTRRVGSTTTTYCMVYGLQANHMPARWQLCVKGPNKNGKIVSDCMETTPAEYDRYREGDQWPK